MASPISGSVGSGAWHMSLAARAEASKQDASSQAGLGIIAFLTAIGVSIAIFAAQFTLFSLLRNKLARIFKPKTYLVPERERTDSPPRSLVGMIRTLISYHDRDVINKCGLDAYFFLRYLRTLLVIFIPICLTVLPILVPMNYVGGKGNSIEGHRSEDIARQIPTGLDTLAWGNISPANTRRYTAHLIMAILVIIWVCTVFFFELRVYVKIRQDYLTSAEHRLRASATTVLVNSIPKKWLTEEALTGLFDVFPGGVRNVWLNRDLTTLLDKISLRDKIHRQLESAETDLIRAAKKANLKKRNAEERRSRRKLNLEAVTKKEKAARKAKQDAEANRLARVDGGTDAGKEQEVPQTVDAAIRESQQDELARENSRDQSQDRVHKVSQDRFKPLHHVEVGLKGVVGVAGKAGRGVEHAIGTSHGFMQMSSNPLPADGDTSSALPAPSLEVPRTASPEGSILTSSSANILRNSSKREVPRGENTVRKLDNIDDMFVNDKPKFWQFWKPPPGAYASPVPQGAKLSDESDTETVWQSWKRAIPFMGPKDEEIKYDDAFDVEYNIDMDTDAEWAKHIKRRDRPTHHLPLFGVTWLFGLPFVTKKVDTIYWCRQELARLNLEIEEDQKHPARFPLMTSAFIQFNHQVAAHMACQSVVHHLPRQMAPRLIEISPRDVEWGNMAVNWWQQLLRTSLVVTVVITMIILWGIPVGWTAAIGQADALLRNDFFRKLSQDKTLGTIVKAISGVLPAAILAILLFLIPVIFGILAGFKGSKTGAEKTEFVQKYYFTFLFVQVFLVVSIASFVFRSLDQFVNDVGKLSNVSYVLDLLARNLPSAAIYFFSYMILQALTSSSGTLLQVATLFSWFILGPLFDSTARDKWARNMTLNQVNWGTVFPVYTNFACIGIVYCVVAPLISIFSVITFSLLWLSQRYAMLYVNRFENDTGGVLYPRAINQTFTGLYFMELCLAGLFFIVVDEQNETPCFTHGVIMLVLCVLTIGFQVMLNKSFSPLFRYLPITFEDEAVLRDKALQREQDIRFGLIQDHEADAAEDSGNANQPDDDEKPRRISPNDEEIELQQLEAAGRKSLQVDGSGQFYNSVKQVGHWARAGGHQIRKLKHLNDDSKAAQYRRKQRQKDLESQRAIGAALYGGMHDEIDDLTPNERDALTQHAFLHMALRARRPTVWIPRDDLGISDDEIRRTHSFSKHIWISNEGTALDSKVRVVYGKNPPDFSEIDIINL
ncbi:hypothetical protein E4U21_007179 [Claviceps maximensis]|nr:hypothetical protein E4U21_007179 [Claviceps maximensis]